MTQHEPSASRRGGSLKGRLLEEIRRYLIVSGYLYVCFAAMQLYKMALLSEEGVHYLPLGLAAGKALILGKFLLIGESARVGSRVAARTLLHRIVYRVLLLAVLLIVLNVLEELLVGFAHGRSVVATLAEYQHRSLPEIAATHLLILLILVPLVTVTEVSRALGPGVLPRLLLASPERSAEATSNVASKGTSGVARKDR